MKFRAIYLCLFLILPSCATTPAAGLRVTHTVDQVQAGSTGLAIDIESRAVDHLPLSWGSPIAAGAPRITGPRYELLGASPSAAETVLLSRDAALPETGTYPEYGFVHHLPGTRVLIPEGCTAAVAVAPDPGLEFVFRASTDHPVLSIRAPRRATDEEAILNQPARPSVQTLLVPWPLEGTDGEFMLALPHAEGGRTLVWRIRSRGIGPDDGDASALHELSDRLRAPSAPNVLAASLAQSLRNASGIAQTRSALTFAAIDTGAALAAECASLADDTALPKFVASAAEALDKPISPDLGWCLDRAAMQTVAKSSAESSLDRALTAALAARYGEVGRDPSTLARLAATAASRADFVSRLESEHLLLLDDSAPAIRVRAFEYLVSVKAAPAGFDPLGAATARRDAVDRHLETLERRP